MDSNTAYTVVADWARAEREEIQDLHRLSGGEFYARAASLSFQYVAETRTLIVRGRVLSSAASVGDYEDIMTELRRIARDEPRRVFNAQFDLSRLPWDSSDEPALYLRRDYTENSQEEGQLFQEWRKLRETAYLWHRTYFGEAIAPVVQRRLNGKK